MSGFDKIKNFIDVTKGFVNKTNLPLAFGKVIIGSVILLEILAPTVIALYSYYSIPNLRLYAKLSVLGLILFTIMATLLYHFPPSGSNYYSFMSNLSTVGGLMLLYAFFNF